LPLMSPPPPPPPLRSCCQSLLPRRFPPPPKTTTITSSSRQSLSRPPAKRRPIRSRVRSRRLTVTVRWLFNTPFLSPSSDYNPPTECQLEPQDTRQPSPVPDRLFRTPSPPPVITGFHHGAAHVGPETDHHHRSS